MGETVRFNKDALIEELKQIHKDMVSVYKGNFLHINMKHNEILEISWKKSIERKWHSRMMTRKSGDENFCLRTSYTLINKVLFIKGYVRNKGFIV